MVRSSSLFGGFLALGLIVAGALAVGACSQPYEGGGCVQASGTAPSVLAVCSSSADCAATECACVDGTSRTLSGHGLDVCEDSVCTGALAACRSACGDHGGVAAQCGQTGLPDQGGTGGNEPSGNGYGSASGDDTGAGDDGGDPGYPDYDAGAPRRDAGRYDGGYYDSGYHYDAGGYGYDSGYYGYDSGYYDWDY